MARTLKVKRKTHWRGIPDGVKHAVREVDGVHMDRAVCGAKVTDKFTEAGLRKKPSDTHCKKCTKWEPLGQGPGGANFKGSVIDLAGNGAIAPSTGAEFVGATA